MSNWPSHGPAEFLNSPFGSVHPAGDLLPGLPGRERLRGEPAGARHGAEAGGRGLVGRGGGEVAGGRWRGVGGSGWG